MMYSQEILTKIRQGYFSAVYFNRTKEILLRDKNLQTVTMQIFQKHDDVTICGINEVIKLFKSATGYFQSNRWIDKSKELAIHGLTDGDQIKSRESVMHITAPYAYFAHLESLYLGTLARMTKIATNARQITKSANGKPVIFFADRFDYFLNQEIDGYAAKIGGVSGVATDAQAFLWNGKATGTIPHSLIAAYNGDTIKAAEKFAEFFPETPLIVLVDFDNDCIGTSLKVAKKFGKKLFAVRLDTSENMIDKSLQSVILSEHSESKDLSQNSSLDIKDSSTSLHFARNDKFGVNPQLVYNVRKALDSHGFNRVKIVVSGGFNADKIKLFEKEKTPADIYGVGSAMLTGNIDFTADIVNVNNKLIAKRGRKIKENKRFKKLL